MDIGPKCDGINYRLLPIRVTFKLFFHHVGK